MLKKEDLTYIKEHLTFWSKLSDVEKQLLENNIATIKYNKGENLHGAGKECLGLVLIKTRPKHSMRRRIQKCLY